MKLANVGLAGTLLLLSVALTGCSEDPPPVVVKPQSAPSAPVAKSTSTSADTLAMQDSVDTADSEYEEEGEYEEESAPLATYSPVEDRAALKPSTPKSTPMMVSSPASSKTANVDRSSRENNTSSNNGSSGGDLGGGMMGMPGQAQPASTAKPVATPRSTLLARAQTLSTHLLLSGLTAANGTGQTLTYDAYFPLKYATATTGPFVFVVHGGDWTDGAKEDVKSYAVALAQKGFVAIAPNYRLAPANPHPAQVDDLSDVMDFIAANPDTLLTTGSKYGAVGVGAGGHLTSLVALSPSASGALKCVGTVFAPSDLTNLPSLNASIKQFLGDAYSPSLLAETSPVRLVSGRSGNPSFYLSHGRADPTVPFAQSEAFSAALRNGGLDVNLTVVEGAGHSYSDVQTSIAADAIAEFMASCLAIQ